MALFDPAGADAALAVDAQHVAPHGPALDLDAHAGRAHPEAADRVFVDRHPEDARARVECLADPAFLFLVQLFTGPVQVGTEVLNELQNAVAGWRRVLAVVDTPADVADPGTAGDGR